MPSKKDAKGTSHRPAASAAIPPASAASPSGLTANQRSSERFYLTHPLDKPLAERGIAGLTEPERRSFIHSALLARAAVAVDGGEPLFHSQKFEREFWKTVSRDALPLPARQLSGPDRAWGLDHAGRDIGSLPVAAFDRRLLDQASLTALDVLSRADSNKKTDSGSQLDRDRRLEMAFLKSDLFGSKVGPYARDPAWDNIVPMTQHDPDGALAAIAYPDDYAEAMSYLCAVMSVQEYSPRALRLTQDVIAMNPAHYTVWLYRFQIIHTLRLPVADELEWLNEVALHNLKNYQIWHHRHLLIDYQLRCFDSADQADGTDAVNGADAADAPAAVQALALSETTFLDRILAEDAKNYHVWSYRQYLVRQLGLWSSAELATTEALIAADVRNNSAWAHRFFLVFSDPAHASTADELCRRAIAHDPAIPSSLIERELCFTRQQIALAPQSQSSWNYLRGVLVKGARPLAEAHDTASQYVAGLQLPDDTGAQAEEVVQSTHALDLLAEIYEQQGNVQMASLCWSRLAEKWDPIRAGYWRYRTERMHACPVSPPS